MIKSAIKVVAIVMCLAVIVGVCGCAKEYTDAIPEGQPIGSAIGSDQQRTFGENYMATATVLEKFVVTTGESNYVTPVAVVRFEDDSYAMVRLTVRGYATLNIGDTMTVLSGSLLVWD